MKQLESRLTSNLEILLEAPLTILPISMENEINFSTSDIFVMKQIKTIGQDN